MGNNGPNFGEGLSKALAVATDIVPVVAHDTSDNVPDGTRALLVGTGGTLNVTTLNGINIDGLVVPAGYNPISVRRVRTGGTAADFWALL